ncbi:hypothetical protein KCG43_20345 [Photobacterium sp. WH24]|uniref:hypothetical protein n=1 Tax=Photobacterium sp. WH24 TaxID=2827237 RepID=UPI001C43BC7F|nr:hypothetical protein [Photobacterium sp. WH24]MBV7264365.1 hypothetical protein [Photobacterium sp. WH24]
MSKQKKAPDYLRFVHTLLQPIGSKTTVTVQPYTVAAGKSFQPEGNVLTDKDKIQLVTLTTGLTAEEVSQMTTPDFNTVFWKSHAFYIKTGYELAGETRDLKDKFITLFFKNKERVSLQLPSIQQMLDASHYSDAHAHTIFMIEQITDLDASEIDAMLQPDFLSLNEAVNDFLSKTADFYQ